MYIIAGFGGLALIPAMLLKAGKPLKTPKLKLREIFKGFRYLLFSTNGIVKKVAITYTLIMLSTGGVSIAVYMLVLSELGGGILNIGLLTSIFTAGLICGNAVIGIRVPRESKLIIYGTLLSGICYLIISHITVIELFYIIYFAMGIFAATIVTPSMTLIQKSTPIESRGRIFSSLSSILNVATLISASLSSFAIYVINSRFVLIGYGIATVIVGILATKILPNT